MENKIFEYEVLGAKVFLMNTSGLRLDTDYPALSGYRKEKIKKIRNENQKRLSLGVELLLIHALGKLYPEITPPLEFGISRYGKLSLVGREDICFSLAHGGEVAVCAVGKTELGVDVETADRAGDGVAERYFTAREKELPFGFVWTRKEAVAKAESTGIGLGLDTFCVSGDTVVLPGGGVYRLATFGPGTEPGTVPGLSGIYLSLAVLSDADDS